jgi:hypothetical protein
LKDSRCPFVVTEHLVQWDVAENGFPVPVSHGDELQEGLFAAVMSLDGTLLVFVAEVTEIEDAVAIIPGPRATLAFTRRWELESIEVLRQIRELLAEKIVKPRNAGSERRVARDDYLVSVDPLTTPGAKDYAHDFNLLSAAYQSLSAVPGHP